MRQDLIEYHVGKCRADWGLSANEPIHVKGLLLRLGVLALYKAMSPSFGGMCLRSQGEDRFMLINSQTARGRQHFTIAHELFHLYVQPVEEFRPHQCMVDGVKSQAEKDADSFATVLLMPADGIRQMLTEQEIKSRYIDLGVQLRLEQYFGVSHQAMQIRLRQLGFQTENTTESIQLLARQYGIDDSLYRPGNDGLIIGDYGSLAKRLFDAEQISESHYLELMSKIGITEDLIC